MFNLGGMEILAILVVALVVLGPDKLPRVMRTVGKAVGQLRRASTEFQRTMNTELAISEKGTTPSRQNAPSETSPEADPQQAEAKDFRNDESFSPIPAAANLSKAEAEALYGEKNDESKSPDRRAALRPRTTRSCSPQRKPRKLHARSGVENTSKDS